MKLLLTSGGITNTSIRDALVHLLGKPIEDSSALCIPTAEYGHPWCTPASAWRFIAGQGDLGSKSVGLLELTALPSIGEERWVAWVRDADGPRAYRALAPQMRSTTRPPSRWSTAPSRSSPKGTGSC